MFHFVTSFNLFDLYFCRSVEDFSPRMEQEKISVLKCIEKTVKTFLSEYQYLQNWEKNAKFIRGSSSSDFL